MTPAAAYFTLDGDFFLMLVVEGGFIRFARDGSWQWDPYGGYWRSYEFMVENLRGTWVRVA